MTGPGRPREGTPVQVRIPPDLLAKVDRLAEQYECSRAKMVRRLLWEAFD